jgi:hypothetical protein
VQVQKPSPLLNGTDKPSHLYYLLDGTEKPSPLLNGTDKPSHGRVLMT